MKTENNLLFNNFNAVELSNLTNPEKETFTNSLQFTKSKMLSVADLWNIHRMHKTSRIARKMFF